MLTRGESGHIEPSFETTSLGRLAVGVVEHLRVLAEEREQKLLVDVAEEVGARCDPGILRQALVNLLDNAIKYTPRKGSIHILVKRTPTAESVVEVRDTGPGIAAVHRERIFERFYRVDEGRSRSAGGTGLGLATARWAVEVNGGHIELESKEGEGSLFRIVLPACDAGGLPGASEPAHRR
jgi:signal transduction histidine kinase